jgi:hypothetical protein
MDPDANLAEQRRLVQQIKARLNGAWAKAKTEAQIKQVERDMTYDGTRLAELVEALDEWIIKGGFLPKRWQRTPSPP